MDEVNQAVFNLGKEIEKRASDPNCFADDILSWAEKEIRSIGKRFGRVVRMSNVLEEFQRTLDDQQQRVRQRELSEQGFPEA